jgi:hypothetical protein
MTGGRVTPGRAPRAAATLVLLVALLAAQAGLQRSFEQAWRSRSVEKLLYLPSGRHLKALTLGFSNLAADVLWIKAIGYFGGHALTDREYPWLYHILDQVTTLDPMFAYPYLFGGITLSVERESGEESSALLAKAMSRYPGEWRYPFYIGYNAFYLEHDPARAALFMRHAASLPRAPEYLPHLAASLIAESGRVDAAVRFLETMAESAREDWMRNKIRQKIADLRAGRIPEGLKKMLSGEAPP